MTAVPEWTELGETGRRLARLAVELLVDRLELAGLELREVEVRLVQCLVVALWGVLLLGAGLVLAGVAVLLFLPPQWRALAAAAGAVLCLVLGWLALRGLRRRLVRRPLPFARTMEELGKDRACF
jgi:uncharacterized membrane protein YqjE